MKFASDIINEERERCAALAKKIRKDPEFLLYCINAPVYPTEDLKHHRKRFLELKPPEDIEDLM